MKEPVLTHTELQEKLEALAGWKSLQKGIEKDFKFADFSEAMAFLTRVGLLSEKMNHHAEYSGVYDQVHLRLSTHDSGGVTAKDVKMAKAIESFSS